MSLKKLTWAKAQEATITLPAPAPQTVSVTTLALDNAGLRWIDAPNLQKLWAELPGLPRRVQIMGSGTPTAYNSTWQDADAEAALLAAIGLTMPPAPAAAPSTTATPAAS